MRRFFPAIFASLVACAIMLAWGVNRITAQAVQIGSGPGFYSMAVPIPFPLPLSTSGLTITCPTGQEIVLRVQVLAAAPNPLLAILGESAYGCAKDVTPPAHPAAD